MNFTKSDAFAVHPGTGQRMHQSDQPIATAVSADDMNMLIWSLMEVLKAAGVAPADFNPNDSATYTLLAEAIQTLSGGGGGVPGGFVSVVTNIDATELENGAHILASGRNTPGDGGGGLFVYASSSTATVDNVIVFAPATGPGRLRREGWTAFGFTQEVLAPYAGVFGNGSDESAAIQAAWDAGYTLRASPGRTYIAKGLISRPRTGMVCSGGRAKIQVPAGANVFGLRITSPNFIFDGIDFDGGNLGPWNVVGAAVGNRDGLVIGGAGLSIYGVTISNCDVYGFSRYGVQGLEVLSGFSFGQRVTLHNVNSRLNYQGWLLDTSFEYVTLSQCYGYECYIGIAKAAGNVTIDSSNFERNWFNAMVKPGTNNSHGSWTSCSFNHAMHVGLQGNGAVYGEAFTGCRFWYSPIVLDGCVGFSIRNSQIAGGEPYVSIIGGGINSIDDNYTPNGLNKVFSGYTFTSFRRNRVSSTDVSPKAFYGDVAMRAVASRGYAYPIQWNPVTDTVLPLDFSLKKWHGEDAAFLEAQGVFNVPRTGYYQFDITLVFNTMASAEKVTLRLSRFSGGGATRTESIPVIAEFAAGKTGCCLTISRRMLCISGDGVALELSGNTAAGIQIQAGGIDAQILSID